MQTEPGYDPATVGYLGHGTTVAANIVIRRKGARTGLLTTKCFRDVLQLRHQEVIERIDAHGRVETPLDPASLAIVVAPPPVITATLPLSRTRLAPSLGVSRMRASDA